MGLLQRVTRVSGVRFHWGLPVSRFGEILALWWVVGAHDKIRRTDSTCRVYCEDGSIHRVPFPSWSWLGWLGEMCVDFPLPLGNVQSELEFYRVDIDGSRLMKIDEGGQQANIEFEQPIDEQLLSCWKGSTTLETDDIQNGSCFRDSGMLRFWTSHALSWLMDSDDDSKCGVLDSEGIEVGYVIRWKQSVRERELYSFIVLSRHHTRHLDINFRPRVEKFIPHPELHVMLVKFFDGMASRVTVGIVSERAWVEAKPQ